jgi:hypothetical protein
MSNKIDTMKTEEPAGQLALKQTDALSAAPVADMLKGVLEKGVTNENVAVLERMVALYERMQDKQAEREFNAAFVALQNELPVIVASTEIPNRGKYAKYEDVMRVVGPLLVKHGFTVSFTSDTKDNRMSVTCHLRHVAGFSQSNSFAVRTGRADTETQADCKAATTAKRNSLLQCLNVIIRQDIMQDERDAAIDGAPISFEQAETLRELVKETRSDEAKFLAFAGAGSYDEIGSARYDMLFASLQKKLTRK